jgi:hypothetical protein
VQKVELPTAYTSGTCRVHLSVILLVHLEIWRVVICYVDGYFVVTAFVYFRVLTRKNHQSPNCTTGLSTGL